MSNDQTTIQPGGPIIPYPPPLSDWATEHLSAIFQATTKKAFDTAFDAFVSKHVDVTYNGKKVSRSHFEQTLWNEQDTEKSATVNFLGVVEVPNNANVPTDGGDVGVFVTTTIQVKKVVIGKPAQYIVNSSFNLVIAKDPSVIPHQPSHLGSLPLGPGLEIPPDFDARRVTSLNVVSVDRSGITPLTQ